MPRLFGCRPPAGVGIGERMDKEQRKKTGDRRKTYGKKEKKAIYIYYRKAVRFLKRRRKLVLMGGAGVLAAISLILVVWAIMKGVVGNQDVQMETVEDVQGEPFEVVEALEVNAYPEVNDLIERYFAALQEGDEETLTQLRDNTENKELLRMQENSSRIESYDNITCYTKSGMEEGSYVVFAYYEVKFQGIDTTLPGITPLYVRRNEEGTYYLHDLYQDDEAASFANEVAAQDDVVELYAQVSDEYQSRLEQDEELAEYVNGYMDSMMAAVGEALEEQTQSAQESAEAEESASSETSEEGQTSEESGQTEESGQADEGSGSSSQQASSSAQVPNSGEYTLTATVNIRKGASDTSDRLAVAYPGETVEILMKQADGWTRVSYQGQTGYVRSDVLQ